MSTNPILENTFDLLTAPRRNAIADHVDIEAGLIHQAPVRMEAIREISDNEESSSHSSASSSFSLISIQPLDQSSSRDFLRPRDVIQCESRRISRENSSTNSSEYNQLLVDGSSISLGDDSDEESNSSGSDRSSRMSPV